MAGRSYLGRREITLDELDEMTPTERHADFESRVVKDLSELPPGYRAELRDWADSVRRHEGDQETSARRES
jgi:hypothetical protein